MIKCPACKDAVIGVKIMIPSNRITLLHPQEIPDRECGCVFSIDDPRTIPEGVAALVGSLEVKS